VREVLGRTRGVGARERHWNARKDKWCGVGAGCELEIIMLCPAEPSSVLRGRLGRVGYSCGRGGVIWGRVVYIMLRGEGGGDDCGGGYEDMGAVSEGEGLMM